jgi:hypothetical protein
MSSSKSFMSTIENCVNEIQRETFQELMVNLKTKELMTDAINTEITDMLNNIKTNNKVKKLSKPRFSGYHLFMKDHRIVIKEQNPDIKPQELTTIVSRAWKDISDEDKSNFNLRAKQMKDEHESSSIESSSSGMNIEEQSNDTKTDEDKKDKKDKKIKKEKKSKKVPDPTESDKESDDGIEVTIENANSDIDI